MKKQLFGLALVCSLSLMGIAQARQQAGPPKVAPSLMKILKQQYVDYQPLTKAQKAHLNKAGKPAIAAGLVALGFDQKIADIMAYRATMSTPQQATHAKTQPNIDWKRRR